MKLWRKPFDHKTKTASLPKVHINRERCKGCGYCVEFCPRKALSMSSEMNPKGYNLAVVSNEDECLSCGYCEAICPEFAIKVSAINSPATVTSAINSNNEIKVAASKKA
jgi:2-oxoglutarate ferredoxin oxidoreductase subunit delta